MNILQYKQSFEATSNYKDALEIEVSLSFGSLIAVQTNMECCTGNFPTNQRQHLSTLSRSGPYRYFYLSNRCIQGIHLVNASDSRDQGNAGIVVSLQAAIIQVQSGKLPYISQQPCRQQPWLGQTPRPLWLFRHPDVSPPAQRARLDHLAAHLQLSILLQLSS